MLLPLEHITQISAEKRIMHYRNCTIIVGGVSALSVLHFTYAEPEED